MRARRMYGRHGEGSPRLTLTPTECRLLGAHGAAPALRAADRTSLRVFGSWYEARIAAHLASGSIGPEEARACLDALVETWLVLCMGAGDA